MISRNIFKFNGDSIMADVVQLLYEQYLFVYGLISGILGETYLQLFLFTTGLFLYSLFVWGFYRSLSKKNLFTLDLNKYAFVEEKHKGLKKARDVLVYILKYGIVFPIYVSLWFVSLSLFILLLSSEFSLNHILLSSIVIVSATRAMAYYNENLAADLAKLIPFALLAVLITNPNFFSMEFTVQRFLEIPTMAQQMLQFVIFSVFLEWGLRILSSINSIIKNIVKK